MTDDPNAFDDASADVDAPKFAWCEDPAETY
jgi:hypothetical protein